MGRIKNAANDYKEKYINGKHEKDTFLMRDFYEIREICHAEKVDTGILFDVIQTSLNAGYIIGRRSKKNRQPGPAIMDGPGNQNSSRIPDRSRATETGAGV